MGAIFIMHSEQIIRKQTLDRKIKIRASEIKVKLFRNGKKEKTVDACQFDTFTTLPISRE